MGWHPTLAGWDATFYDVGYYVRAFAFAVVWIEEGSVAAAGEMCGCGGLPTPSLFANEGVLKTCHC